MAGALLVALWCATTTTAAATRYGDYGGARMPQYGAPEYDAREPDEYRGHSPDAVAHLDYKYEEELAGKTSQLPEQQDDKKDAEETDSWQRPIRKHKKKKPSRLVDEHEHAHDGFDPEDDFPKPKISNRFLIKHRPRLKSRKHENDDESEKYPISHSNIHDETPGYSISQRHKYVDEIQENEKLGVTEDDRNEKQNSLDNRHRYGRRERVARRKPRDKFERGERDRGTDVGLGSGLDRVFDRASDRESDIGLDRIPDRRPDKILDRQLDRNLDRNSDKENQLDLQSDRDTMESDVDRWMSMRDGLGRAPEPGLDMLSDREKGRENRRRPDIPIRPQIDKSSEEDDSKANYRTMKGKGKKTKNYDDYNNDYYDMKRVMNIKNKLPSLLRRNTVREEVTESKRESTVTFAPVSIPEPSRALHELLSNRRLFLPPAPATRTTLNTPTTQVTTEVTPISTSTSTKIIIPSTKETKNGTELSLAEKSRLSIMKKAMRKENKEGRSSTTKPPVLLQVTMKMPTVVMVEPPSSESYLRAREVYADSPARLDKVKRLMRHKLVASARNIHDLTDNWDDLVCDYIDMSLLENVSATSRISTISALVLLAPVVMLWLRNSSMD